MLHRATLAATCGIGLSLAVAATPAAAAAPVDSHQRCVTVIAHPEPGHKASKTVSRSCAIETGAQTTARRSAAMTTLSSTLLVIFFEDIDYAGDSSEVWGDYGTCDAEGYGISDMDGVQDDVDGVSSYQLVGACNVSEKFGGYNFTGTFSTLIWGQNQSWVGTQWNDYAIKSFWMYAL
jgi:hypothetical protein